MDDAKGTGADPNLTAGQPDFTLDSTIKSPNSPVAVSTEKLVNCSVDCSLDCSTDSLKHSCTTDPSIAVKPPNLALLRNEVMYLLQLHPAGLKFAEFSSAYLEHYGKTIEPKDYHYNNLFIMFVRMSDLVTIVKFKAVKLKDNMLGVPKHKLLFSETNQYMQAIVPASVQVGDYYECKIPAVYDLSKFWLVVKPRELEVFQEHLKRLYELPENCLSIPVDKIKVGLPCIVKTNGAFYRAIINNTLLLNNQRIRCFFVDFGTILGVNLGDIYYLNEFVASVPRFACRGCLAYVQPVDLAHPWPAEVVHKFQDMIQKHVCFAKICQIDEKGAVLHVALREQCGHHCDYINDILVAKKLAVRCTEKAPDVRFKTKDCVALYDYMHLYPPFQQLEEGKVPSTYEEMKLVTGFAKLDLIYKEGYEYKPPNN